MEIVRIKDLKTICNSAHVYSTKKTSSKHLHTYNLYFRNGLVAATAHEMNELFETILEEKLDNKQQFDQVLQLIKDLTED